MRIIIIGSGNTATVLGKAIIAAGHQVLQVAGRNRQAIDSLAVELVADSTTDLKKIRQDGELYIIAVADDAIAMVTSQIQLGDKMVVHTAGSVSKEVLKNCSSRYGVLWPIQSLRKEMRTIPEIPFLVDANNEENAEKLALFALSLKGPCMIGDDEKRLRLHLAAVMVSNFTNHLYALAEEYCTKEKISFDLLHPLVAHVAERIRENTPKKLQTGPALRHDQQTIHKHLQLLEAHPALREFYELFTKSIERMYL